MWLGTLCTPGRKGSREGCEGGSGNGNGNGKGGGLLKWEGKSDGRGWEGNGKGEKCGDG